MSAFSPRGETDGDWGGGVSPLHLRVEEAMSAASAASRRRSKSSVAAADDGSTVSSSSPIKSKRPSPRNFGSESREEGQNQQYNADPRHGRRAASAGMRVSVDESVEPLFGCGAEMWSKLPPSPFRGKTMPALPDKIVNVVSSSPVASCRDGSYGRERANKTAGLDGSGDKSGQSSSFHDGLEAVKGMQARIQRSISLPAIPTRLRQTPSPSNDGRGEELGARIGASCGSISARVSQLLSPSQRLRCDSPRGGRGRSNSPVRNWAPHVDTIFSFDTEADDEIQQLQRMTSWATIGTTGTSGTTNTASTTGTDMTMITVEATNDDDGNAIPEHFQRKIQVKRWLTNRKGRRKKLVKFEYPPISSLRQRPRTDPKDVDALFFSENELDQIEDDRFSTTTADDVEVVAVATDEDEEWDEDKIKALSPESVDHHKISVERRATSPLACKRPGTPLPMKYTSDMPPGAGTEFSSPTTSPEKSSLPGSPPEIRGSPLSSSSKEEVDKSSSPADDPRYEDIDDEQDDLPAPGTPKEGGGAPIIGSGSRDSLQTEKEKKSKGMIKGVQIYMRQRSHG